MRKEEHGEAIRKAIVAAMGDQSLSNNEVREVLNGAEDLIGSQLDAMDVEQGDDEGDDEENEV